jgi:hypothetical protein
MTGPRQNGKSDAPVKQIKMEDGSLARPKDKLRADLLDLGIRDELGLYSLLVSECRPFPDLDRTVIHLLRDKMYLAACALIMQEKDVNIEDIIKVYTLGVPKYGDASWKKVRPVRGFLSSALKHAVDGTNHEDYGLPHWVHCCWNLIALRWFEKNGLIPEEG